MLSAQSRSFVAITNNLTNDFSTEELFITKSEEKHIKPQTNLVRIESKKCRGEFVEDKKISQNVKNLKKCPWSWSDFRRYIQVKSGQPLLLVETYRLILHSKCHSCIVAQRLILHSLTIVSMFMLHICCFVYECL